MGERGKEGGLKISEKILLGGEGVRNFNFGGVGGGGGGGRGGEGCSRNFEVKIKTA